MNAFFIGIGGMGMSGLAKILFKQGYKVAGSDRDLGSDYCKRLSELGVKLYPQDGTGPEKFMQSEELRAADLVIVKSTAVEDHVADVVTAERLNMKQIMRSDLLAQMFNEKKGIAIGGTAGKTTTTGLMAWILKYCKKDPSCAVGGIISGLDTNAFHGNGEHFVIEADESDGSIVKYKPYISLVTNISRDHKTLDELKELFTEFIANTSGFRLLCGDDEHALSLRSKTSAPITTYGTTADCDYVATDILSTSDSARFRIRNIDFEISLPGEHNVLNATAAIAIANLMGIELEEIARALKAFPGMKRRFEKIGTVNGIMVIDDFAHNPAEIAAAINTARKSSRRRFIVYQPHGFGPANFTRDDLIKVLSSLRTDEFLFLDDIYYGGGTVERNISSKELIESISQRFKNAYYLGDRSKIVDQIVSEAESGDMVLVMGARDINKICQLILDKIPEHKACQAA